MDPAGFEVLSFDCYGTLVDWERGITDALLPILRSHGIDPDPDRVLELYAACESETEAGDFVPYREVLSRTVGAVGTSLGVHVSDEEAACLARSLPDWPVFPDTVEALRHFARDHRIAVISNVDEDLFAGTAAHLGVPFDFVVTAQSVGAYKPDVRVFRAAEDRFGMARDRWLHVAQSIHHDIAPASELGIRTVHVDRRGNRPGGGAVPRCDALPTVTVADLDGLVDLLGPNRTR